MSIKYLNMDKCISYLKNNKIVAFPTETVYGLGGNAFDTNVINDIYRVKERLSQDPLIVHIDKIERIIEWNLVNISEEELEIIKKFTLVFSPGPFTMILKSSKYIPDNVTGNTNYVGIRIPNNKLALELIEKTGLPIAAPSANKFGHISPTRKEHVYEEFKNQQILDYSVGILDIDHIPNIGIESTIVKFDFIRNNIRILRPGFITKNDILNVIKFNNLNFTIENDINYKSNVNDLESSGELIKHYAPNCDTILIKTNKKISIKDLPNIDNFSILDMNNLCIDIKNISKYYKSLGFSNNIKDISKNYYYNLREFELENINIDSKLLYIISDSSINNYIYDSLLDRMTRSSSGNILVI